MTEVDVPQVLYRMFDVDDRLLYVGITLNPDTRFPAHQREKPWWSDVATIRMQHFPDRAAVAKAELEAIRAERPVHNMTGAGTTNSVQITFRIDEATRRDAVAIAKIRKERDGFGFGASVIVRQAIAEYVAANEHVLPEDWQPPTDD